MSTLPQSYLANGFEYTFLESPKGSWGIYEQRKRGGTAIVAYELVRRKEGRFPPKDKDWGVLGFTFSKASHSNPLQAARDKLIKR